MKEPLFTHGWRSATTLPPSPKPGRTKIEIFWSEEAFTTMKIRRHYVEMAKAVSSLRLGPGYRQGQVASLATAKPSLTFAARSEGGAS